MLVWQCPSSDACVAMLRRKMNPAAEEVGYYNRVTLRLRSA
jgi:hypothetical protein